LEVRRRHCRSARGCASEIHRRMRRCRRPEEPAFVPCGQVDPKARRPRKQAVHRRLRRQM
ncbi:MAG: hypothetical protein AVDCRST_MAG91-3868, partial [uncultured Sphingomonadaceae bacterium]